MQWGLGGRGLSTPVVGGYVIVDSYAYRICIDLQLAEPNSYKILILLIYSHMVTERGYRYNWKFSQMQNFCNSIFSIFVFVYPTHRPPLWTLSWLLPSPPLDNIRQCSQSEAHLCEQFLQVQQIGFVILRPLCCA